MTHNIWVISRTIIFRVLQHVTHKLWVSWKTVYFPHLPSWVIDYESLQGRYIFRISIMSHGWYRMFPYISTNGPYILSQKTVYFIWYEVHVVWSDFEWSAFGMKCRGIKYLLGRSAQGWSDIFSRWYEVSHKNEVPVVWSVWDPLLYHL